MSANRMHYPDTVHFITNRCEHEMFLMLPTERIAKIIQYWFARALCLYGQGLEFYAFIFLSNHVHFLVNDTRGTLAAFMWYFQGNVAKAINKELGRKGKFWSREYDDVIITSDEAFMNRYAYTVGNAVKSGLVDKSEEWIGWSSLAGALSDGKYCFEMLNKTKLHNATCRGQKVAESKFVDEWRFELTIPPMLRNKSDKERQQFIRGLCSSSLRRRNDARERDRTPSKRNRVERLNTSCGTNKMWSVSIFMSSSRGGFTVGKASCSINQRKACLHQLSPRVSRPRVGASSRFGA